MTQTCGPTPASCSTSKTRSNSAFAYLGVIAAGRCVVPIDPAMPDGGLARALTLLRPAAVIGLSATGY